MSAVDTRDVSDRAHTNDRDNSQTAARLGLQNYSLHDLRRMSGRDHPPSGFADAGILLGDMEPPPAADTPGAPGPAPKGGMGRPPESHDGPSQHGPGTPPASGTKSG